MQSRTTKSRNILHGGAILMEAIMMVGVLMLSLPLIMQQINRRNERVENLMIANEIKMIYNAAGGLVVFDKDDLITSLMIDADIVILSGDDMKNRLIPYGFPDAFSIVNPLDLTHGVLLHKVPAGLSPDTGLEIFILQGYVISKFGGVNTDENYIKINEVLNDLGWNAAFIDSEGEIISNLPSYTLPISVQDRIGKNVFIISLEQKQNFGDYMAKSIVNEDKTYNTMMTTLNMNSNSVNDLSNIDGFEITVSKLGLKNLQTFDMELENLSGTSLTFFDNQSLSVPTEITVKKLLVDDMNVSDIITVNTFDTRSTVEAGEISTKELQIENSGQIESLGFVKSITTDVLRMRDISTPIYANTFQLKNAIVLVANLAEEFSTTVSPNGDYAWKKQVARISPNDKSTIIKDIQICCALSGGSIGTSSYLLSQQIYDSVLELKEILNAAMETWPDFSL